MIHRKSEISYLVVENTQGTGAHKFASRQVKMHKGMSKDNCTMKTGRIHRFHILYKLAVTDASYYTECKSASVIKYLKKYFIHRVDKRIKSIINT